MFEVDGGPAEVRSGLHDAVVVDDTRRADTDSEHGRVRVVDERAYERDDRREDVGALRRDVDVVTRDDLAVEREHGAEEPVTARKVDTDDAMTLAVEVDEDRGLAGAGRFAHAALRDVAVVDELGDEIRDRDAREPRLAGEIRPRHGTLVEEGLQHERSVVRPGVLGQDLRGLSQRAARPEGTPRPRGVLDGGAPLRVRSWHVC